MIMMKRRVMILALAVVAVLAGVIWWAVASRPPAVPDPVYDGHPLSFWVDPSSGRESSSRGMGTNWFPSLDSNAIPYLIQTLKKHDGIIRKSYDRLWPYFPGFLQGDMPGSLRSKIVYLGGPYSDLTPLPGPRSSAGERVNSCFCLALMGARARPAIPELIRLVGEDDDGEVRTTAVWALANVARADDQSAMEALKTAATKDMNPNVSGLAGWELARFGPVAADKAGVTNPATGTSP